MASLPTFDLVVATVDRIAELQRLLASLERQTYDRFRVVLADQNEDDRLDAVVARTSVEIIVVRSPRGLSRARNEALGRLKADVAAFPDDDAVYPDDLLERVARRLAENTDLDGVSGRLRDPTGRTADNWAGAAALVRPDSVWHCAASSAMFLRRTLLDRIGRFDEALGLGSPHLWSAAEEIDLLARAVRAGARILYDPELDVVHDVLSRQQLHALGFRDGAAVGYVLAKNGYPAAAVGRMLVRPAGGALLALLQGDLAEARFQARTLHGRLLGLRGGARARATAGA